jgi:adenylate cyclase
MADVFVSYARRDKARVAPLVAAIEAKGWTVWWDPEICPGQEFDRQIAAELKIATAVLVVWTLDSVESRWVRGEAREGAERGIMVPVRFDRAEMPIDVRTFHTTDLDDWGEDPHSPQVQEVVRALGAMIAHKSTPRTVTAVSSSAPPASTRVLRVLRSAYCPLPT